MTRQRKRRRTYARRHRRKLGFIRWLLRGSRRVMRRASGRLLNRSCARLRRFGRGRLSDDRPRVVVRLRSRAPVPVRESEDPRCYHWDWWDIYACGARKGYIRTLGGNVARGERCGRAGCWSCDRVRLRKVVAPGRVWARADHQRWSLYTFTLGVRDPASGRMVGAPARSRDDLAGILARWRRTILSATRAGLWSGGHWVFEVVPLRGGGLSSLPCPYRETPPAEGPCSCVSSDNQVADETCERCGGSGRTIGAAAAAVAAHTLCVSGRCLLCKGAGLLPVGHVHVHALVLGRPCWYGDPTDTGEALRHEARAAAEGWHSAPGGKGLLRWAERYGWGRVRRDPCAEADSAALYLAKAAGAYAAKGAPNAGGAFYSQAYLRVGALRRTVYAASFGCLYGLRVVQADPSRSGWCPGPGATVTSEEATAFAVLSAVPRVTVAEGDPSECAARWSARRGSRISGPNKRNGSFEAGKPAAQPRLAGVGGSPHVAAQPRSEKGAAERGSGDASPGGRPSLPQSQSSVTVSARYTEGAGGAPVTFSGAAHSSEARASDETLSSYRAPADETLPDGERLSSSTGPKFDSAQALGRQPLRAGPALQAAHWADWWEPYVQKRGRWYVGGCATSVQAFEIEAEAERFALVASLSRILGVYAHDTAGHLHERDTGSGEAALNSWSDHYLVRASFGQSAAVFLPRAVVRFARARGLFERMSSQRRSARVARLLSDLQADG